MRMSAMVKTLDVLTKVPTVRVDQAKTDASGSLFHSGGVAVVLSRIIQLASHRLKRTNPGGHQHR